MNKNILNKDFKVFPQYGYDEKEHLLRHKDLFSFLISEISKDDRKILDVGSATGAMFFLMPNVESHKIYGVDVNKDYTDVFNRRGFNGVLCNIEKESLPFGDGEFDLVICNSILEHTLLPKKLFSEVSRVLRPGGRVIFSIPNATSFTKRWNHLRGRNLFSPLIDNLLTLDYQKRCAVLYSAKDLKYALAPYFKLEKLTFLNEGPVFNSRSIALSVLRSLSVLISQGRDNIIVTVKK